MNTKKAVCSLLAGGALALGTTTASAIPAFPEAQGWGAASVGGRGGRVIAVTNLNDSGAGSLRAALEADGPRIVVFRVAGVIHLQSAISLAGHPFVTVAGQTAPGGGITLRGARIRPDTHDVVIRFLSVRPGLEADKDADGFKFTNGASRVVLDHTSVSWARDENFDIYCGSDACKDITFSSNLIGEGLKGHSCGLIAGGAYGSSVTETVHIDIIRNLVIHAENRMPFLKIRSARIVNNLFSHGEWMMTMIRGGIDVDILGNSYRRLSSGGGSNSPFEIIAWGNACTGVPSTGANGACGNPSIFIEGNQGPHATAAQDNWNMIEWESPNSGVRPPSSCRRAQPQPDSPHPIQVLSAVAAQSEVLSDVGNSRGLNEYGAWIARRDAVDARLVQEYETDKGLVPASPDDVGGYPPIAQGTPYADADLDGMADVWEAEHGFSAADPKDGNLDCDDDGYTNVEEFLNGSAPCKGDTEVDAGAGGAGGQGGWDAGSAGGAGPSDGGAASSAGASGSCHCTVLAAEDPESGGVACSTRRAGQPSSPAWVLLLSAFLGLRGGLRRAP